MRDKLLKLMQQYPNVELIPMIDWESNSEEYSVSTSKITSVSYEEYVLVNDKIVNDKNEALDIIEDILMMGDWLYESLDKKEQYKLLNKEYNKFELKSAIFIYIG